MNLKELFSQARSLLTNAAGVEMSFGSPTQIGEMHIIPVARVGFGFGGGGGKSASHKKKAVAEPKPETETQEPESSRSVGSDFGGGGGGGLKTDPVGIYTIKGDVVKFHPVISIKEMLAVMAIISVLILRLSRIRRKRK